jgi:hypothetical protein
MEATMDDDGVYVNLRTLMEIARPLVLLTSGYINRQHHNVFKG